MAQATHSDVYPVSQSALYQTIIDYESYPEFVENMVHTEILDEGEDYVRARFTAHVLKDIHYILDLYHEPEKRVWWELVEGEIFSKVNGSWTLKQRGKNKTEVSYHADVDAKIFVPRMLMRRLVGHHLPAICSSVSPRAAAKLGRS